MASRKKWEWGEIDPATGKRQYPLTQPQYDLLKSTARFSFGFAGTGSGKSVLIPLWLLKQLDAYYASMKPGAPAPRLMVVVPSYPMMNRMGLLDSLQTVLGDTRYKGDFSKASKVYVTNAGGQIFFASAEYPESIEGGQFDGIAIDEVAQISYEAWRNAKARAGQKKAPIFGTGTPDVNGWLFNEIIKACDQSKTIPVKGKAADFFKGIGYDLSNFNIARWSSDGQYYVRHWSSAQNATYALESVENAYRTLAKGEFERRYLGAFASLDGLVYDTFSNHVLTIEPTADEFRKHPAIRTVAGVDFGFDPDPCAVIVGVECQDGRLYVVEEVYERRLSYDQLANHCRRLREKWGIERFYCDSSGKAAINELVIRGINASKRTIPSIAIGCQMVNARLRTDLLKVYSGCGNLIDEAGHYAWPKDREGDFKETPRDKDNHLMDALRYLVTGLDYMRPLAKPCDLGATPADKERLVIEREIRLGRASADPVEQQKLKEQQTNEAYRKWFYEKLMLDTGV